VETGSEPAVPRQRWRIVLARDEPGVSVTTEAWEQWFEASGLSSFRPAGRDRPRVAFAAPLSPRMVGERELADVVLTDRQPAWRVREALGARLPDAWRLVDVFEIWLGEPALAGQLQAADYRIELVGADAQVVASAAASLLAAEHLPRERAKGASTVRYDLRPLLIDVRVTDPGPAVMAHVRTRFHPELGSGRPDEVVAALGESVGVDLIARRIVRQRLILADDVDGPAPGRGSHTTGPEGR
jgi:Uncharacterized protein conserved in bacteria (DUF2344)